MPNEKSRGELRTDRAYKQLSKTEEGKALVEVLKTAGGRAALARALNVSDTDVNNWCSRGKVSKRGAEIIGESLYFTQTKHDMLPGLTEFQWLDGRK